MMVLEFTVSSISKMLFTVYPGSSQLQTQTCSCIFRNSAIYIYIQEMRWGKVKCQPLTRGTNVHRPERWFSKFSSHIYFWASPPEFPILQKFALLSPLIPLLVSDHTLTTAGTKEMIIPILKGKNKYITYNKFDILDILKLELINIHYNDAGKKTTAIYK